MIYDSCIYPLIIFSLSHLLYIMKDYLIYMFPILLMFGIHRINELREPFNLAKFLSIVFCLLVKSENEYIIKTGVSVNMIETFPYDNI